MPIQTAFVQADNMTLVVSLRRARHDIDVCVTSSSRPPSLVSLSAQQLVGQATRDDDAWDVYAPILQRLPSSLQSHVVAAASPLIAHAPDGLLAMRLGRCLPEHRETLWGFAPPIRALSYTPLHAIIAQPETIPAWAHSLATKTFSFGFRGNTALQTRLKLFADLCEQGGFAPGVIKDSAVLATQLRGLIARSADANLFLRPALAPGGWGRQPLPRPVQPARPVYVSPFAPRANGRGDQIAHLGRNLRDRPAVHLDNDLRPTVPQTWAEVPTPQAALQPGGWLFASSAPTETAPVNSDSDSDW